MAKAMKNYAHNKFLDILPYAILETIKDPLQVLDRNYRIVWCNSFRAGYKQWFPEELVGRLCYEEFFNKRRPCPDCPISETFATGKSGVRKKIIPHPDGSHHWREVHSYPLLGLNGRTDLVVKIGFDITPKMREQNRTEKYLQYLEKSLQSTNDSKPDQADAFHEARDRFSLTSRELEVLRLLASGFTNAKIANLLSISPNTVKTHVVHIFDKLGVGDRAQAAVWATRMNLV